MKTSFILNGRWAQRLLIAGVTFFVFTLTSQAQTYTRGQHVEPAFEGWRPNADGSFNMMFGFMTRQFQSKLHNERPPSLKPVPLLGTFLV